MSNFILDNYREILSRTENFCRNYLKDCAFILQVKYKSATFEFD